LFEVTHWNNKSEGSMPEETKDPMAKTKAPRTDTDRSLNSAGEGDAIVLTALYAINGMQDVFQHDQGICTNGHSLRIQNKQESNRLLTLTITEHHAVARRVDVVRVWKKIADIEL
jgi:hypothetical protein